MEDGVAVRVGVVVRVGEPIVVRVGVAAGGVAVCRAMKT